MADEDNVTIEIEAMKEMVVQLGNAFIELESHSEPSSQNKTKWEDIKQHFHNLVTSLEKKLADLEEKKKAFEEKQSEARKSITEREEDIVLKERALLDRLQELKDTAVSAIAEAHGNCKVSAPVLIDPKVSTTVADDPSDVTNNKSGNPAEAVAGEAKPSPQLKELCEQMDVKGVLKFLSDNRKNLATISTELTNALKSASEPARLVLDSLEGFFPPDPSKSQESEADLQLLHRICNVLLESAAPLLGMAQLCEDHPLSSEIKQRAKEIADEWKAKLAGMDINASNGYSLEVVAFLQLLATYSIADKFDEDELCKLVLSVSRCRRVPDLCRALGLTHKMPGFLETLVKSGKQIEAVHFAYAFQLTESFPPVALLKEYLDNSKTATEEIPDGTATASGQEFSKELNAVKIVIKCIKEYKLQDLYPVEPLQKRMTQLERAKSNKKRTGQATTPQAKKPRSNGYAPRMRSYPVERYHERHNYAAPSAYDMSTHHLPYGQPPSAQGTYRYADERVAPPVPYGTSSNYASYAGAQYQSSAPNSYNNYGGIGGQVAPSSYGGYTSSGPQPPHQPYM